jgi:hypothetical protein
MKQKHEHSLPHTHKYKHLQYVICFTARYFIVGKAEQKWITESLKMYIKSTNFVDKGRQKLRNGRDSTLFQLLTSRFYSACRTVY